MKGRLQRVLNPIMHAWERVVTIGIHEETNAWDYKRVRLLNGISAMGLIVYALYVLSLINSPDYVTFYLCMLYAVLTSITLILNYFRRYRGYLLLHFA